ncbi:hypothetical protein P4O66_006139, partial [Electrophorus voltai]
MATELLEGCDKHLSELKSPFMKDDLGIPADISESAVLSSRPSARECDGAGPGDSKLSPNDNASGMENCLIHPQTTSKSLPLDLVFQSTEPPVEQRLPVRAVQEHGKVGVHGNLPVCMQLSASTWPQAAMCPTCKSYRFHHHHQCQELHSCSSDSKTQHSLKTIAAYNHQVAGDDLCASFMLGCLFCQLEDCLVAMGDGCQLCMGTLCSSLCSKVCCCDPFSLQPFLEECPSCDPASCLDTHCCLCRGPGVDNS